MFKTIIKEHAIIYRKFPNIKRNGIIAVSALLIGAGAIKAANSIDEHSTDKLYVVDVTGDNLDLTLENGNHITINGDKDNLYAIVNNYKTKDNQDYLTYIVGDNGIVAKGSLDGKYLEDKAVSKINLSYNLSISDAKEYSIINPDGVTLRTSNYKKTIDLPYGSSVISVDNGTINGAYYDSSTHKIIEVPIDDENKKIFPFIENNISHLKSDSRYKVNTGVGLKVRNNPSTSADVIAELDDGDSIFLLYDGSITARTSYDEDNTIYSWGYVATIKNDRIVYGYSAIGYYTSNGFIRYIEQDPQTKEDVPQTR